MNLPGSEERIRAYQKLVRQRQPLHGSHLDDLPERVGWQEVTLANGTRTGIRVLEQGPRGRRVVKDVAPERQRRPRQGPRYPCERRYRADPAHKAAEARRKKVKRMQAWLACAEYYLHPCGQWFAWMWTNGKKRRQWGRNPPKKRRRKTACPPLFPP